MGRHYCTRLNSTSVRVTRPVDSTLKFDETCVPPRLDAKDEHSHIRKYSAKRVNPFTEEKRSQESVGCI